MDTYRAHKAAFIGQVLAEAKARDPTRSPGLDDGGRRGAGDGSLRQGAYVDAADANGTVTHDKLLNTLIYATGHRDEGGEIVRFGDESLEGGLLDVMLA